MRLRDAEETHQAIAEKLVDVSPEAGDRSRGCLLIPFRDPMPLFGIEARGDRGRADQVAEQRGYLPPFAVGGYSG
jgi:hypothetical protein